MQRLQCINILYIANYYRPRDASSISTYEVIKALSKDENHNTILTNDMCNEECPCELNCKVSDRVRVLRVSSGIPNKFLEKSDFFKLLRLTVGYLPILIKALSLNRERRFDCVFSQHHSFHLASYTASLISRFVNIPHVIKIQDVITWRERSNPLFMFMYILNRYAIKHAEYVLTLSSELGKIIEKEFHMEQSKIVVIPNTVDVNSFSVMQDEVESFRKKICVYKCKILVFVGQTRGRGLQLLVRALPKIVSEIQNFILLIVSRAPDKDLIELANQLYVGHYIRFVGPLPHKFVPAIIHMSDLTIGPLHASPLTIGAVPRKVLECMACSKTVIAAYNTVSHDLLIHGYNGLFVKEDPFELADVIVKLLRSDDITKELGENAKKHISRYYSSKVMRKVNLTVKSAIHRGLNVN